MEKLSPLNQYPNNADQREIENFEILFLLCKYYLQLTYKEFKEFLLWLKFQNRTVLVFRKNKDSIA